MPSSPFPPDEPGDSRWPAGLSRCRLRGVRALGICVFSRLPFFHCFLGISKPPPGNVLGLPCTPPMSDTQFLSLVLSVCCRPPRGFSQWLRPHHRPGITDTMSFFTAHHPRKRWRDGLKTGPLLFFCEFVFLSKVRFWLYLLNEVVLVFLFITYGGSCFCLSFIGLVVSLPVPVF